MNRDNRITLVLIFQQVKCIIVCYTAVFRVVTQRSSLLCEEERRVTKLKTAV